MVSYNDFQLTSAQIEHIKRDNATKAISKYIKENGFEPSSTEEYFTATDEELEQYRRIYYSMYLSRGYVPSPSDDDSSIITGDTSDSGSTRDDESGNDSGETDSESSIEEMPDNEIWYTSYDGNIIIPNVTVENALCGSKLLTNVYKDGKGIMTFENDITFIARGGFEGISSLKTISIPKSIETIESWCFAGSGLKKITIPSASRLTTIKKNAFHYCTKLKSINIPFVEEMGANIFFGCSSLTEIALPSNCKKIGSWAFIGCSNLSTITIKAKEAPTLGACPFYDTTSSYIPYNLVGEKVDKENRKLKIYEDATGYYDGLWATDLIQTCGYTIEYI